MEQRKGSLLFLSDFSSPLLSLLFYLNKCCSNSASTSLAAFWPVRAVTTRLLSEGVGVGGGGGGGEGGGEVGGEVSSPEWCGYRR